MIVCVIYQILYLLDNKLYIGILVESEQTVLLGRDNGIQNFQLKQSLQQKIQLFYGHKIEPTLSDEVIRSWLWSTKVAH